MLLCKCIVQRGKSDQECNGCLLTTLSFRPFYFSFGGEQFVPLAQYPEFHISGTMATNTISNPANELPKFLECENTRCHCKAGHDPGVANMIDGKSLAQKLEVGNP